MEKCRHMKNTYELIAPCHFGLESVLKREIYDLGYDISKVEDGKVTFIGDADAIARANIFLRTAERVLLKVGEFKATTLLNCLIILKNWNGKNSFLRMASSGLLKLILSIVSSLAHQIYSQL